MKVTLQLILQSIRVIILILFHLVCFTAFLIVPKVGCFNDDLTDHALPYMKLESDVMTWSLCARTCARASFNYAGLQDGRYCYCGNSGYDKYGWSTCTTPCTGNAMQICGDETKITVVKSCASGYFGPECDGVCNCDDCDVQTGICITTSTILPGPQTTTRKPGVL